ncbi:sterol desaturase family protein [Bradyrhizobium sp. 157]|uniref:sterol desaturase family protein n=1 Tax=Bradyrhizobium sp. 157 TaxID=2782631 RepID=UPI001FF7D477|nr:sterol desaturase family protein [Bradyrhizobium sp. 157]MCK1638114.1 sterol desaturase family protein [Bradyrhizobium sp. 157]
MDLASFLSPSARAMILVTALGFMALEYGLGRLTHRKTHDWRESAATLGVAVVQSLMRVIEAGIVAIPFAFVYEHRLFEFSATSAPALLGLFLGMEFFYYWQHRASHRIRWMWATHRVHHSATRFNLTAAIRLGWTGNISGNFLFFLPLAWIGFHPFAVIAMLGINLMYQFFIHTELAPRLGPLELVLNTPAHHRVHHASNEPCLDKNFGGMLIIFDRLFGTFAEAPAQERLRYGLVGGKPSFNPVRIALGEWSAMFRDVRKAAGVRAKFRAMFGPPG